MQSEHGTSRDRPGTRATRPPRAAHGAFFATLVGGLLTLAALGAVLHWRPVSNDQLREIYRPLFAILATLLALWSLVYGIRRGPLGWKLGLVLLAGLYWGVERLVPAYVHVPFGLRTWWALRDPDHRPHRTYKKRGWNADSLRCPHPPSAFTPEDTNVVFLGDSFTFGMNLAPAECFPQLVEDRLRARPDGDSIRVANFAWTSSSPLLSWRRLVDIGDRYHPDMVVLCVDMTDIRDDIRWGAMLEKRGAYGWIARLPLAMRALEVALPRAYSGLFRRLNPEMPAEPFFMSEAPLEETRPFFAEITRNLARIETWCRERDAHFVVIVLPRTYQCNERESPKNWEADRYTVLGPHSLEPFRYFEELAGEVAYPIHSLLKTFQETEVFPTSFEDDPHWNPAGAEVAAGAVYGIVVQELIAIGLLEGASD